jgi:hypothetical protein
MSTPALASRTIAKAAPKPTPVRAGLLQRQCACGEHTIAGATCEACRGKEQPKLPRDQFGEVAEPVAALETVRHLTRSSGQPLDPSVRGTMESLFGHDFSGVRIHSSAAAAKSAIMLSARAYTIDRNIIFASGEYAPRTREGRKLLAHELTHVVQQHNGAESTPSTQIGVSHPANPSEREAASNVERIARGERAVVATPAVGVLQRKISGGEAAAGIGIGLGAVGLGLIRQKIARFFGGGTFSDQELKEYLDLLDKTQKIEGHYDSDNKAREIVKRWKAGNPTYAVLTVPVRTLLIQEMADGYLSGDDQEGILNLLEESIPSELVFILPRIKVDALKPRFDGDRRKRLDAILDRQETEALGLGDKWSVAGTKKVITRHGDKATLKAVIDIGYKIVRFDKAFDKWRYDDGHEEENEVTGLLGNTERPTKKIRLNAKLTNELAAETLFHESQHALGPETTTEAEYLEQEAQARIEGEKFGIRHGLPEMEPGYRTATGQVDVAHIRSDVTGSPHYNPTGRTRIGRRYVGDVVTTGWDV